MNTMLLVYAFQEYMIRQGHEAKLTSRYSKEDEAIEPCVIVDNHKLYTSTDIENMVWNNKYNFKYAA